MFCGQCCHDATSEIDLDDEPLKESRGRPTLSAKVMSMPAMSEPRPEPPKPELPKSYTVKLQKPSSDAPLGIHLDLSSASTIHIVSIREGVNPVSTYNMSAPRGQRIQAGDFITKVNNTGGDAKRMIEAIQTCAVMELAMSRPVNFSARIPKQGASMGLELKYAVQGCSLAVDNIEDGAVKEFNSGQVENQVRKGDRILAVNGKSGNASDLLKLIQDSDPVMLELSRPAVE